MALIPTKTPVNDRKTTEPRKPYVKQYVARGRKLVSDSMVQANRNRKFDRKQWEIQQQKILQNTFSDRSDIHLYKLQNGNLIKHSEQVEYSTETIALNVHSSTSRQINEDINNIYTDGIIDASGEHVQVTAQGENARGNDEKCLHFLVCFN